jgi:hypothetical protein
VSLLHAAATEQPEGLSPPEAVAQLSVVVEEIAREGEQLDEETEEPAEEGHEAPAFRSRRFSMRMQLRQSIAPRRVVVSCADPKFMRQLQSGRGLRPTAR